MHRRRLAGHRERVVHRARSPGLPFDAEPVSARAVSGVEAVRPAVEPADLVGRRAEQRPGGVARGAALLEEEAVAHVRGE